MNVIDTWSAPSGPAVHAFQRIAVIGGGAWGTALAMTAARAGRTVALWCRNPDIARDINQNRRNDAYLPGIELSDRIAAKTDLAEACAGADAVLLVTPSGSIREMSRALAPCMPAGAPLTLCAKGIEVSSGKLLTDVAAEECPTAPIAVLSGPTFASETALAHPTAVTIAARFDSASPPEDGVAARLAVALGSEAFRPYVTDDVIGVEIGGAMKNVIAICCGMMTGAGFAENTRAALIARGVDEMKTLADAMGGRRETVTGLSGVGDLSLTCSSMQSRNMSLGVQLGEGRARDECFDGRPVVVEGEINSISVTDLARKKGVDLPICEAVRAILHDGAAIGDTFAGLWSRPLEAETRTMRLSIAHPADAGAVQRFAQEFS